MELCSIASGSSGNCVMAGDGRSHLLIDAGISGRRIERGLQELGHKTSEMKAILVTHEHIDHISGIGVLARKYSIPIYATEGTKQAVLHTKTVGSIDPDLFHTIGPNETFRIGDLEIIPIRISHDAADPVAYKIRSNGTSAAVVTDLGRFDHEIIEHLRGLHLLLLEANHDVNMLQTGPYPYYLKQRILGEKGHLSNEASGRLLCRLLNDHIQAIVLGHLSKENNLPELAYETVKVEIMMSDTDYQADDFPIYVAKRSEVSQMIEI